jgi:hypothetical protein
MPTSCGVRPRPEPRHRAGFKHEQDGHQVISTAVPALPSKAWSSRNRAGSDPDATGPFRPRGGRTQASAVSGTRRLRSASELNSAAPMKATPVSPVTTSGTSYRTCTIMMKDSTPMAQCAP